MLFRIAQEALTNIQKHSNAQHAWLQLEQVEQTLVLVIRDDGQGFDANPTLRRAIQAGHLGLATMHELASSIGGGLKIVSTPRHGTAVRVTAPYRPELCFVRSLDHHRQQRSHTTQKKTGSGMSIRILLVDDHKLIRLGLQTAISRDQAFRS